MIAKRTKSGPRPRQRPGFETQLPGFRNQLMRDRAEDPCQSADEQRGPGQILPRFLQFQRRLPIPGDQIHGGFLISFARHQKHRPRGSRSLSNPAANHQPRPTTTFLLLPRSLAPCSPIHSFSCSLSPLVPRSLVFLTTDHCSLTTGFPAFLTTDHCSLTTVFTPPPHASGTHPPINSHPTPHAVL
jgi:hypothetical protein